MKLPLIFCQMIDDEAMKKTLIVCVSIIALNGFFAKSSFSEEVSSNSIQAEKASVDSEPMIRIVDKSGQIIRKMQTQEEIDDWQMEVKCEEKNGSPIMLVGMPKDKAGAFQDVFRSGFISCCK